MLYSLMNQKNYLFTDGSVSPKLGIGFGAFLHVKENDTCEALLKEQVCVKKFTNTSSTKLELETLLWALGEVSSSSEALIIFTDCQNILGLQARREKFEKHDYLTAKHKKIANHELYKVFYTITDTLDCEFVKVKGHKPKHTKDNIDALFTLVDKASRDALRTYLENDTSSSLLT